MPIYEYVCQRCGYRFEELAKTMTSSQKARCPKCHKGAERIFSVFAAHQSASRKNPSPGECGMCCDPDGPCPMGMN